MNALKDILKWIVIGVAVWNIINILAQGKNAVLVGLIFKLLEW